jgi:hypothetical protein
VKASLKARELRGESSNQEIVESLGPAGAYMLVEKLHSSNQEIVERGERARAKELREELRSNQEIVESAPRRFLGCGDDRHQAGSNQEIVERAKPEPSTPRGAARL